MITFFILILLHTAKSVCTVCYICWLIHFIMKFVRTKQSNLENVFREKWKLIILIKNGCVVKLNRFFLKPKKNIGLLTKFYLFIVEYVESQTRTSQKFYLLQWKPFKNDEKDFSFHLKSSLRSQDIKIFVLNFWSSRKNGLIRKMWLFSKFMMLETG